MVETTQLNKYRQRHSGNFTKTKTKENKTIDSYFYPKHNLYTRQEFELLDTIYADEPSSLSERPKEELLLNDFWPQNKEEFLTVSNQKSDLLKNIVWFLSGVMLTSAVWLIFFQVNIHEIKTKTDTQIVFQKSAKLMTDKTLDKEVASTFKNQGTTEQSSSPQFFKQESKENIVLDNPPMPVSAATDIKEQVANVKEEYIMGLKEHIVINGDSLWTIANKYYSNPSPDNIKKIMKANKMRRVGVLSIGQKVIIPE